MPFNGSGTFVPIAAPDYPAVTGTTISSTAFNNYTVDLMANGLSKVLVRDGQAAMTGVLNFGGFRGINLATPSVATDAATYGAVTSYAVAKTGDTMTGALGVGAAAAAGSISDTTAVRGGVFRTFSGDVVAISGVAQGLVTIPDVGNNGTYIVSCGLSAANPTLYSAVSLALMDNNVLRVVPLVTAALMSISNSGNQITATQSSGGNSAIYFTLTRIS